MRRAFCIKREKLRILTERKVNFMKKIKKGLLLFFVAMLASGTIACNGQPEERVTLKNVALKEQPTKIVYYVNEEIDVSGAKLTLLYTDGSEKELAVTTDMITPKIVSKGEQDVIVSYKEGDVSKTAKFTVTGVALAATDLTVRVEGGAMVYADFKLAEGFTFAETEFTTAEEYAEIYEDVLSLDEETAQAAAQKIKNDVITAFYYMDGAERVLLVKGTSKQAKNKYWGGYLFRIDDATGEGTRVEGESEKDTYIGVTLPKLGDDEHFQTSVYDANRNIFEDALEKGVNRVFVDVVIVYDGYAAKTTASAEIKPVAQD